MFGDTNSKTWFHNLILKWPRASIVLVYALVNIIVFVPFYRLMPVLLSYAPGLIENVHVYKMIFKTSYATAYWFNTVVSIFLHAIPLTIALGGISDWKKLVSQKILSEENQKKIMKIRKKCNNIPYYVMLTQIILPIICVTCATAVMVIWKVADVHLIINSIKLMLLFFSISGSMCILSFIFAKKICKMILLNTDINGTYPGFRVPFRNSLAMQMILMFIVGIMITSLAGYAKLIEEKSHLLLQINKKKLHEYFDSERKYAVDDLKKILSKIKLDDENACTFYLGENGDEFTSDKSPLYDHYKIVLLHLSHRYNGKIIIGTGELQGASIKINTDRGPYFVGIKYLVVSKKMVQFFVISFVLMLLFNSFIFFYFSNSISGDISLVTDNLNKISQNKTIDLEKRIPVVSNDEIGDLVMAFNKIQKITKEHIEQIKNSETIIREKERLASLGQLVGGIAHNLRTPIMSLAGGLEGLKKLIEEYDQSIGNAVVTNEDHHEIARDMEELVKKLRPYCTYMSDVITTVKEQSMLTSSYETDFFTLDNLIKRVNILNSSVMKHCGCKIVFHPEIPEDYKIDGNITILLQVLNNLIMNASEAYQGKGGDIDLFIRERENNLEFEVRDYGAGIPEDVRDRLFREMVTTKGSKGTGLGLFTSMSRIISSFNGTMRFESTLGKGTSMYIIILPATRKAVVAEETIGS